MHWSFDPLAPLSAIEFRFNGLVPFSALNK